jgi:hypothetical protein
MIHTIVGFRRKFTLLLSRELLRSLNMMRDKPAAFALLVEFEFG